MVLKVAVKPLSQSCRMEMRALLDIAEKMYDWRAERGICGKVKRELWVERMVEPLGRQTRIP